MLHIILGILTILLTILKWLGILLLILLLLALLLLAVVLLVPVRYRGRGKKTAEKLEAQLSVTWLLRLLAVEAACDAGKGDGRASEDPDFGRTYLLSGREIQVGISVGFTRDAKEKRVDRHHVFA